LDADRYLGDRRFIEKTFARFDNEAMLDWLRRRGLEPVLRKKTQYFCPTSSREILHIFEKTASKQRFLFGTYVKNVNKKNGYFHITTNRGTFVSKRVIVASGGLSFPALGATGIGYEIAETFGHTIVPTAPALVGLTLQKEQFFFKTLSGISLETMIEVDSRRIEGALLFAHRGITGPAVLDASLYWKRGIMTIDFLTSSVKHGIRKEKRLLSSLLPMPKRAAKALLQAVGAEDVPGFELTASDLEKLERLERYAFAPAGTFGYSKAEVTKGGVCTEEIDAETMESRLCGGLYFTGEVLDVTGRLGGYNFQWAFSSGYVAAKAIESGRR
jgi:predicted Rossmann fold flavoprotein